QRVHHLAAVAGELGRVEDHRVVALAAGHRRAHPVEDVGLLEVDLDAVGGGVGAGDFEDARVEIHTHRLARAGRHRVHGKAAGVAAQVEHAAAFRQFG